MTTLPTATKPTAQLITVRVYRSRYSRIVSARLTVEASTREEAIALLRGMATAGNSPAHMAAAEAVDWFDTHEGARATLGHSFAADWSETWAAADGRWYHQQPQGAVPYARWTK